MRECDDSYCYWSTHYFYTRWEIKKGAETEPRVMHLRPLKIQLVPFKPKQQEAVKLVIREDPERRQEKRKSTKPVADSSGSRAESTRSAAKRKAHDTKSEPVKSKLHRSEPSTALSAPSSTIEDNDELMECNSKGEAEVIEADKI